MTAKLLFITGLVVAGFALLFEPLVFIAVLLFCAAFKKRYVTPEASSRLGMMEPIQTPAARKVNRIFLIVSAVLSVFGIIDTVFFILNPLESSANIWGLRGVMFLLGSVLVVGVPVVAVVNSKNRLSLVTATPKAGEATEASWLAPPKKTIDLPLLISTIAVIAVTLGFWLFTLTSLRGPTRQKLMIIDGTLTIIAIVLASKLWQNYRQLR